MELTDCLIIGSWFVYSFCTLLLLWIGGKLATLGAAHIDKMNKQLDRISDIRIELREHYEQTEGKEFGE